MAIPILVVDDQPSVRAGLKMRLALEPDLRIVGEAGDGLEALQQARRLRPDVVTMDVELPRMDGIAATAVLSAFAPESAVVILSLHDDARLRERARGAGAGAFVSKQAGDVDLLNAIRAIVPPSRAGND
jgi:DNA-binding NarL/FixJ family response regulator